MAAMKTVIARQGDTVDLISLRHYGVTAMVEAILEANPGLAKQGAVIAHGTVVKLPERVEKPAQTTSLWD